MARDKRQTALRRSLLAEEARRGERTTCHVRWLLLAILALLMGHEFWLQQNLRLVVIGAAVVAVGAGYNLWLLHRTRRAAVPVWLRYLSVSLDLLMVSGLSAAASMFGYPLAVTAGAVNWVYPLLLLLAALRMDRMLILYATLAAICLFNAAYYLRYPHLDQQLLAAVHSAGPTGELIKSGLLALFGAVLLAVPRVTWRLVRGQTDRLEQVEAELLPSYQIIQNMDCVVLRLDAKGRIRYVNPYGLALFGYRAGELLGRPVLGTILKEFESDGRDLGGLVREAYADPESHRDSENENVTKGGARLLMRWRNTPIYSRHGELVGFISLGLEQPGSGPRVMREIGDLRGPVEAVAQAEATKEDEDQR